MSGQTVQLLTTRPHDGAGVGDVGGAVGEPVGESVGEAVGEADGEAVGETVGDGVGETVGNNVGVAVGDAVGKGVGEPVGEAVGEAVMFGVLQLRALITRLTVGDGVASLVTQPKQLVAVRRDHLAAADRDPAVGYASYILAASPETCGQAMEVPELE
mmetsp:Transcript_21586/g.61357  ORF Transcript_21586/g.61357 Transcript_21586/m.61357 type:complete len:158 (+) Transcript_21586:241-714(+)